MAKRKKMHVLLVEDDPGDVDLTKAMLEKGKFRGELAVVADGLEALAFLRREGQYRDAPRPDVILLDLNLPRKGGRETLTEIRESPGLQDIPVIVLTASRADQDMLKAYNFKANFINKPVTVEELRHVLRSPEDFFPTVQKPG